ncbi:MAG TPA: 2-oxoglutarate dehydrogenase, E2 component, dihydrolipoamide succinyltransferase [Gaiellaceae bacterium]|nr:2-oxoglutarate dehydrogenase, E2 component, dihydrolipoamide succinyltransferase [Gaiellaceae bacterium]
MVATETAIDVVMPQMGVSVSEGTITKWLKQEGETVQSDEPLLEISTDKVDTEVPSPGAGVVQQILVAEGETVEVGSRLAVIAPEGAAEAPAEAPPEPATQQAADESTAAAGEGVGAVAEPARPEAPSPPPAEAPAPTEAAAPAEAPAPAASNGEGKSFVSPVVARIASEHGVDVSQVPGTGTGGRVTKKDILAFIASGAETPEAMTASEAPAAAEPAAPAPAQAPAPPQPTVSQPKAAEPRMDVPALDGEIVEAMSAMRRGIADHMRRSLDTSAHVTSAIEVDMSRVVAIRQKLKKEYQAAYGVNPTYLAFVARVTVETLRDYPFVNGEIRGDKIVTKQFVNLGFAVELAEGKGLIVPVVRSAEQLNLLGMARAIADVASRARSKQLLPDDVAGGTFTITNPGGYGTFHGTPIISQPQSGILGTYALVKRPWVVEDDRGGDVIAIRPIMNITLTYDHRLVDGAYAGRFLHELRERLESWEESNY